MRHYKTKVKIAVTAPRPSPLKKKIKISKLIDLFGINKFPSSSTVRKDLLQLRGRGIYLLQINQSGNLYLWFDLDENRFRLCPN